MAECRECGYLLEDGATECAKCGHPAAEVAPAPKKKNRVSPRKDTPGGVCGNCGALLPANARACLICGKARSDSTPWEEFPVPDAQGAPPIVEKRQRKNPRTLEIMRRWSGLITTALAIVVVAFTGVGIYREYFDTSSYRANEAALFVDATGMVQLTYPGLDQPVSVEGLSGSPRDLLDGELLASPNGRRFIYSRDGVLYSMDLVQQIGGNNNQYHADKLAEGVKDHLYSRNSEYVVYLNGNSEMFASNYTASWMLDSGVTGIIAADDARILYTRESEEGFGDRSDLCVDLLAQDAGSSKVIDHNVIEVLDWTPSFDKIMYTSFRMNDNGTESICINAYDQRQNIINIVTREAGWVISTSPEKNALLYAVPRRIKLSFDLFIEDDLLAGDRELSEPELSDYPLLEQAFAIYGEAGDLTDIEGDEALVEENFQYSEEVRLWEEKLERDALREYYETALNIHVDQLVLYDLYAYRDGVVRRLDTGVLLEEERYPFTQQMEAGQDYALYERLDPSGMTRLKLSALWEDVDTREFDPMEYLFSHVRRELRFSTLGGDPRRVYVRSENATPRQWIVTPGADGLYFAVGAQGGERPDEYYYAPIQSGEVGDAVLIMQQNGLLHSAFGDNVLFQTEPERELYYLAGGVVHPFSKGGAAIGSVENDGETLIYYADYLNGAGTLHLYAKSDRVIAEEVSGYHYCNDSLLYFTRPGERGVDLYLWRGGEPVQLGESIEGIIPLSQ